MLKSIYILLFLSLSASYFYSQDLQTTSPAPQDSWKSAWTAKLAELDGMFKREQDHFRLMQTYQNEATEELIIKDIDSLNVFMADVNTHIELTNKFYCPNTEEGRNAAETLKLKVEALKEYFEQNMLQIQVNNSVLQRKLKNESLDFRVSQIKDLKLGEYTPAFNE